MSTPDIFFNSSFKIKSGHTFTAVFPAAHGANPIGFQNSFFRPPAYRSGMHAKDAGYITGSKHTPVQ